MTRLPSPKCMRCGELMQRLYIRTTDPDNRRKRYFDPVGWVCTKPQCKATVLEDV